MKTSIADRKGFRWPMSYMVLSASMMALGLPSSAAMAQTKIEQMIVTAQKRAQDLQMVPASISAFSGETLKERQITDMQGALSSIPNVTFSMAAGFAPTIAIRGVSPDASNQSVDPSVAFNIDGVYQARVTGIFLSTLDLANIEVLRGPQGTLYGRNANAGVINVNSARPTDTFEGSATVSAGSYNRYGAKGYVSGPVYGDKVQMRLAAVFDRQQGWGKNIITGSTTEESKKAGARLSIRLKPVEELTLDLIGTVAYEHSRGARFGMGQLNSPTVSLIRSYNPLFVRSTDQPWRSTADFPPEHHYKTKAFTAIGTWDATDNITVKSITGFQHGDGLSAFDVDTMPFPHIHPINPQTWSTFSQEFNVNARLWDRVDAVLGLYYLEDHMQGGSHNIFRSGFPTPVPNGIQTDYELILDQRAKTKAVFFDATVDITDDLRLLLGVRRTFDRKRGVMTIRLTNVATGVQTSLGCIRAPEPKLDYQSTTGRVGLQYDFTPDIMGYVQWQNGFKTGGYPPSTCNASFKPEKISDWEAGIKSTLFNGSMTLNIGFFNYDYKDMQVIRNLPLTSVIDNSSAATIRGAELEAVAYVTDNLKTDLSIGYLDTKYKGYQASLTTGSPLLDLTGNRLTKAPKLTVDWGIEYTMLLGELGELKPRVEASYRSKYFFSAFNTEENKQDRYITFNAFLTYTPDNSPFQLQLYVKNLGNRPYRTGSFFSGTVGNHNGYWGAPRLFGADATVKF